MEGNAPSTSSSPPLADVRLIVKSANQQFEDIIIHSAPTWTIRRLKAHLTQVYPSNPTVPEQKLIYSGQLLSDELILKDILRSYKDVETENHIFHLVYTPKMSAKKPKPPQLQPKEQQPQPQKQEKQSSSPSPSPMPSTSTDGLRHRNVTSSSTATVTPTPTQTPTATSTQVPQQTPNLANPFNIPQMAAGCPNTFPNGIVGFPNVMQFSFPGQFSNDVIAQQQAAVYNWVQQVYANYMEQCLKMANAPLNAAQMQPQAPSIPMFVPHPHFMPQNIPAPQVAAATSSGTASSSVPTVDLDGPSTSRAAAANFAPRVVPVIPAAAQPQPAVPTAATAVPPNPAPAPAPAPAQNVEQPQPRFPNIVQEEQDNRDWLDSFYSVTRLLALLTLVYFYSSPVRCLVVALIAVGIYLYHIGFFQTRRPVQATNGNINNNQNINDNNAAAENAPPAQEQNATPATDASAGDPASTPAAASDPVTSSSVTPPEAEPSTTSLIAFVRTFVVSFFASLLPETPAL